MQTTSYGKLCLGHCLIMVTYNIWVAWCIIIYEFPEYYYDK